MFFVTHDFGKFCKAKQMFSGCDDVMQQRTTDHGRRRDPQGRRKMDRRMLFSMSAMRFVDHHCKAKADWELLPPPIRWELTILRTPSDAWYEDNTPIKLATYNSRFEHTPIMNMEYNELCAIA